MKRAFHGPAQSQREQRCNGYEDSFVALCACPPAHGRVAGAHIVANGGLSYMSFDRNGGAGTAAATKVAFSQIAEGEGQAVTDMLVNTPPVPGKQL